MKFLRPVRVRTLLLVVVIAALLTTAGLEIASRAERRKCVTFHEARAAQFEDYALKHGAARPDVSFLCRTLADWHRRRIGSYQAVRKLDYQAEMAEDMRQTQREYPVDQWIGLADQGRPPTGPIILATPQMASFEEKQAALGAGSQTTRSSRP